MHKIFERLRSSEAGMSLLEVVVAMIIFTIVSLSVLQTLTTVLTVTRDNRARVVATNLAAQEIDLARDIGDVFDLRNVSFTKTLNGDEFTVTRSTKWVPIGGTGSECGTGESTGALQYKSVNIKVTWPGMRTGTEPVQFDTLVAPDNRINDPELGTILISVLGGAGDGVSGVTITVKPSTPANGAKALTQVVAPTDSQGCAFALKVVPGHYDVTLSRTDYRTDVAQEETPTKLAQVTAGGAASLSFNFDHDVDYHVKYAENPLPGNVQLPKDMSTTFVSSYGQYISPSSSAGNRTVELFPWRSGYTGIAGELSLASENPAAYCEARNPALWPSKVDGPLTYTSPPAIFAAAQPGGDVDLLVPMGMVPLTGVSGDYIRAVSIDTPSGTDVPGCNAPHTLDFGTIDSSTARIALPYGAWRIERHSGSWFGSWNPLGLSGLGGLVGSILNPSGTTSTGVVIVDPRVAS